MNYSLNNLIDAIAQATTWQELWDIVSHAVGDCNRFAAPWISSQLNPDSWVLRFKTDVFDRTFSIAPHANDPHTLYLTCSDTIRSARHLVAVDTLGILLYGYVHSRAMTPVKVRPRNNTPFGLQQMAALIDELDTSDHYEILTTVASTHARCGGVVSPYHSFAYEPADDLKEPPIGKLVVAGADVYYIRPADGYFWITEVGNTHYAPWLGSAMSAGGIPWRLYGLKVTRSELARFIRMLDMVIHNGHDRYIYDLGSAVERLYALCAPSTTAVKMWGQVAGWIGRELKAFPTYRVFDMSTGIHEGDDGATELRTRFGDDCDVVFWGPRNGDTVNVQFKFGNQLWQDYVQGQIAVEFDITQPVPMRHIAPIVRLLAGYLVHDHLGA